MVIYIVWEIHHANILRHCQEIILSDEILRQNAKLSIVSACGPDNKSFSVSISPLSTSESIWARFTAQQRLTPSKLQSESREKTTHALLTERGIPKFVLLKPAHTHVEK